MSKLNIALMFVLIGAGALVYHTMTNVHLGDVAAYNNVPQRLDGLLVKAGDIVALTSDGRNPEPICRFNDESGQFEAQETNAVYVNELGKHLPTFAALFSVLTGGLKLDESDQAEPDSVRFSGNLFMMSDQTPTAIDHECECRMAERLARKERVCTALAALMGTGDHFAKAVRFARYSNYVNKKKFESCGFAPSAEIEAIMTQRCDQFGSLPWDASLRHFFQLIERRELPPAQVSALATE